MKWTLLLLLSANTCLYPIAYELHECAQALSNEKSEPNTYACSVLSLIGNILYEPPERLNTQNIQKYNQEIQLLIDHHHLTNESRILAHSMSAYLLTRSRKTFPSARQELEKIRHFPITTSALKTRQLATILKQHATYAHDRFAHQENCLKLNKIIQANAWHPTKPNNAYEYLDDFYDDMY